MTPKSLLALTTALFIGWSLPAHALDTAATSAMVVDFETGTVLLEKDAHRPIPPASMSKLMTLNMLFEALQDGRFALDDTFTVSEKAWQKGGSKMFLEPRHRPTIEDLIRGIIIHSGNDACIVVAENLAGSEDAFAALMTQRARELGMEDATFANSTGWPHPDHRMSAFDLVQLGKRMIRDFPEYYPYFAESEFTWDGITQSNRNPLLYTAVGGDGLKTGHTEEAGYGLVGSATQGDRRVVMMVTGLESSRARAIESERLTSWAFREFENVTVMEAGTIATEAPVWIGAEETVSLVIAEDIRATIPRGAEDQITAQAIFDGPLPAPIAEGQELGQLVISIPDMADISRPLYAANAVPEGGFMTRVSAAAGMLANDAMTAVFGGE
jgi:D-alanyl-D-alanine carboxypeptidase (penicillin-binding protein 5/6)